jgi:branched-chain amino acid transport system substrate-binding protein
MKRITVFSLVLVFTLIFVTGLIGCNKESAAQTMDIGICTPLTGPVGNVGTNYQNGVLMAIVDQNAKGGVTIAGKKYQLNAIARDDKFDATTAQAIAEEMVFSKKVKVIFGPANVEAHAVQGVTNPNKVFMFAMSPSDQLSNKDLPYNFFAGGIPTQMYSTVLQYTVKYYPDAKTVVSMFGDMPDAAVWFDAAKAMTKYHGLTWLGSEQFPMSTTDYSPVAQKVMAKNPDIIDMSGSGGALGAVCGTIVKQLREEGFKGIILQPTSTPPGIMATVPKEYLYKIVTNDINTDSSLVTSSYRDFVNKYAQKFNAQPIDMAAQGYNAASAFFQNMDGQKSMDTSAWLASFETKQWKGIFGEDARLIGSAIYGLDRCLITNIWVSEWKDGKLETNFTAGIPYELWRK